MADYTSSLFLAIRARNLTGPGLASAGASLRSFGLVGGLALAGVAVAAVRVGSQFDSMTQAVANNTTMGQAGLAKMRTTISALAATAPGQLDDLAQGYMHITNYGNNAADTAMILRTAEESALSTHSRIAGVANTLANVMHEYSIGASGAAGAMDVLHLAAAQGNATLEEFSSGGARAIDTAANMGVSFQQVTAALSALSRHESLRDANTQLVGLFSKIVNPAKQAQQEIAALSLKTGVNLVGDFTAAGLRTRGLTGVLADLKAATGGNVSEMFKLVPALRGGMAGMLLTGTASKDYRDILSSLVNVQRGASPTATAFANSQRTLGAQLGILRNQVHLAAIELYHQLQPALTQMATWAAARGPAALRTLHGALTAVGGAIRAATPTALALGRAVLSVASSAGRLSGQARALVAPLLATRAQFGLNQQGAGRLVGALVLLGGAIVAARIATTAYRLVLAGVALAQNAVRVATVAWGVAQGIATGIMTAARLAATAYTLVNNGLALAILAVRTGVVQEWVQMTVLSARIVIGQVATAGLAAAQWLLQGAAIAVGLATSRQTLFLLAQNAALLLVRGATALWTGAQWLLNAALYANPIGLVVVAIAGLTAGVVWAYKNVGWFHTGVNKLWSFLSGIFVPMLSTVGNALKNVLGGALSWVSNKVQGLIGFFGHLLDMVARIPGVHSALAAAYDSGTAGRGKSAVQVHHTVAHHVAAAAATAARGTVFGPPAPRGTAAAGHDAATNQAAGVAMMNAAQRAAAAAIAQGHPERAGYDAAQTQYRQIMALYRGHLASAQSVTDAINRLQGAERSTPGLRDTTAILRAQLQATEHRRNDAIRHAAAAQQTRTRHHNEVIRHHAALVAAHAARRADAIRHHGAVMAQRAAHHAQVLAHHAAVMAAHARAHAQRVAHAALLTDLRGNLTVARRQEGTDKRAGNRPAALADIARIVNLDRRYELARTGNKALSDQMATSLGASLTSSLDQAQRRGLSLVAPRASGLARGAYGLYPRTTPGQAAEFGTTTAAFGRSGDTGQAAIIRLLTAQLDAARQQADYYKRKYDQDESLLVVGTQTRDGVRALVGGIGRGPVTPATDPLRLTGRPRLATLG